MDTRKIDPESYGTTHSDPYRLHLPLCHPLSLQLCGALGDLFALKVRPRYTIARMRRIGTSLLLTSVGPTLPKAYGPFICGLNRVVTGIAAVHSWWQALTVAAVAALAIKYRMNYGLLIAGSIATGVLMAWRP